MAGRRHLDIPAALGRGRDRFEGWRRTRQAGTRIPDELWSLAVKLADGHGLSRTASGLGLDYYSLRKRDAHWSPSFSPDGPDFSLITFVTRKKQIGGCGEELKR